MPSDDTVRSSKYEMASTCSSVVSPPNTFFSPSYRIGKKPARLAAAWISMIVAPCAIRNTTQTDKILRNLTVREVMEDMETLVRITYSGRYGQLYTETSPIQRKIMDVFGLTLPT